MVHRSESLPATQIALTVLIAWAGLIVLHLPLLRLPYFWDEAGYYIPAARDLFLHGDLIPRDTLSNAHPPLVMAWLALFWKMFGFSPLVTRTAMLLVAALALAGIYQLGRQVANREVALGATICTALFPVFFAQGAMAHLDMAVAALSLWGMALYLRQRRWAAVVLFSLSALAKETAILTPLALALWEAISCLGKASSGKSAYEAEPASGWRAILQSCARPAASWISAASLLVPLLPLGLWFLYHHARTGYTLGNPEFLRYNLTANLHPARFLIAVGIRIWQLFGYMNLFILTVAMALAMWLEPVSAVSRSRHKANGNGERHLKRPRIAIPTQAVFAVVIAAHIAGLSVMGGAVLARYMLPVYPLVILICVSTLWRRVPWWPLYLMLAGAAFAAALVVPPPYYAAPEDSLEYARFIRMHQQAAQILEQMAFPPHREALQDRNNGGQNGSSPESKIRVLTAWPASDELTKPYLGHVGKTIPVLRLENFSGEQVMAARSAEVDFDAAFLFSTKYEPRYPLIARLRFWQRLQERFFDYHRDLDPQTAAGILGGRLVYEYRQEGEWVAILLREGIENARLTGDALILKAWQIPLPPVALPARRSRGTSSL
jgi:hypothetical protein